MNYRELYKRAMRCYRVSSALHTGTERFNPDAYHAAVSLVREVTGKWDIPEPRYRFDYRWKRTRGHLRRILYGPCLCGVRFFQS